jgi:hypothetical protein
MGRRIQIMAAFLVVILLILGACGPAAESPPTEPTSPAPAEFEVVSLDVEPIEVTVGEVVTITAVVENTGGNEGTYSAVLTVDDVTLETKETVIAAGASEMVIFSLTKDVAGTYEIGVGELSSGLTVKEELGIKEVELGYDDGIGTGGTSGSGPGWGYSVHFSPPATPFTIVEVKVFARLRTGYVLDTTSAEIWDEDFNVLCSVEKAAIEFSPDLEWVTIDVPDITVDGDFRVVFFTNGENLREGGVGLSFDLKGNVASEVVRSGVIIEEWPGSMEQNRPRESVNWMIRVVGIATLPEY